jgi:hypothetical protein
VICYSLRCSSDHEFEAWFKDSKTYDRQRKGRKVACPLCGDTKIVKAPMAPSLSRGGKGEAAAASAQTAAAASDDPALAEKLRVAGKVLAELRDHVEKNSDYVGDQFAEEARRIHYGETEERNIYGETSDAEAEALKDEGVAFHRIPWVPRHDA